MKIQTIGIMSTGDMGQGFALQLHQKGYNVCTALDNRSARTRALAMEAGATDVGSVKKLATQCDVILSIMNPAAALEFAGEIAQTYHADHRKPLFVDCNAIAPVTMHAVNEKIIAAGGRCIDAGIIGSPPRGNAKCRVYLSGPGAHDLEQLATANIEIRTLSANIGDASAMKMCYGALNKGVQAMVLEIMVAARRLGVDAALADYLGEGRGVASVIEERASSMLPAMPPKAYRWAPEMLEIAATFEAAGLTPRMFQGAADMYEFVATKSLARETPENRDKSRTGKDVIRLIADEPPDRRK